MDLYQIRPSQLYVDQDKIDRLRENGFNPLDIRHNAPLPVKKMGGEVFLTDGHARACLYDRERISMIPVYWDEKEADMDVFSVRLKWCRREQLVFIRDLRSRILPHDQYVRLWIERCLRFEEEMRKKTRERGDGTS